MDKVREYMERAVALLQRIVDEQQGNLDRAADEIVKRLQKGRLVYVMGTGGHSKMLALELFHRAGGLAQICPMFPPGVGAPDSHPSTENVPGLSAKLFDYYRISAGDVLIIANAYGFNALTIDSAVECRKRGILCIGITSAELAHGTEAGIPARHPSSQNLCDLADIVIDSYVPAGDAIVSLDGLEPPVAAVSTIPMTFIVNALVIRVAEKQLEAGMRPKSGGAAT